LPALGAAEFGMSADVLGAAVLPLWLPGVMLSRHTDQSSTSLISMTTVGAYEAKTHLPRLLEQVERGETIVITKHGREVAKLVPADQRSTNPDEVIAALLSARRGLRRGRTSVRRMIDEGRR